MVNEDTLSLEASRSCRRRHHHHHSWHPSCPPIDPIETETETETETEIETKIEIEIQTEHENESGSGNGNEGENARQTSNTATTIDPIQTTCKVTNPMGLPGNDKG